MAADRFGTDPVRFAWIDGGLVDLAEARVSLADRGLMLGDGLYESLSIEAGRPFAWRRHYARLAEGCDQIGLDAPGRAALREAIAELVDAQSTPDARCRITVTGGVGGRGPLREGPPSVMVTATPERPIVSPTPVVTGAWTRDPSRPLAGVKTMSSGDLVVALRYAAARSATEYVFSTPSGELCEGARSNIVCALDGVGWVTPPLSTGCLPGVTRSLLLDGGIVDEAPITIEQFRRSAEVLLTASPRGVQPVSAIDGVPVGTVDGGLAAAARDHLARLKRGGDPEGV